MSLEGIAVLNIPSMHGGSNLWGETKKSDSVSEVQHSEVITDPELLKTISQGLYALKSLFVCVQVLSVSLPAY